MEKKKDFKAKLEYIWIDGVEPTPTLRAKTLVVDNFDGDYKNAPMWIFDGSSTNQAPNVRSDLHLKPVCCVKDPLRSGISYLVLCEVVLYNGDPHPTNYRATIEDESDDFWFGFEQEYILQDLNKHCIAGFPGPGYFPAKQGPYYCGVGSGRVVFRDVVEEHLQACIDSGIGITGINAEVLIGQWEYQIFGKGGKTASDHLWIARYLLDRICEKHNIKVDLHPKPITGDWNGSGMHANFSNEKMRTCGDEKVFHAICENFGKHIKEHIDVYGAHNEMRLTGKHET